MKVKKILAAFLASAALFTTSAAYAETIETSTSASTVKIGRYDCYLKSDGQYYTMLDGSEWLVIDVSGGAPENQASVSSIPPKNIVPPLWPRSDRVTLVDNQKYIDVCDVTNSNYYSPIYDITPKMNDFRIRIKTGQWLSNVYDAWIELHHQSPVDDWDSEPVTLKFGLFVPAQVLIVGTASAVTDMVAIEFAKPDGKQETVFEYDITVSTI